jgi:crotonobetainyl-CoA:carnitine CoA-transferase CaiB-like acyl-CoA transferase
MRQNPFPRGFRPARRVIGSRAMAETEPRAPLAGTVILAVGQTLPGYYCLALLRDLGAEVVRVERPARGGDSPYAGVARGFPVRSLSAGIHWLGLDLKSASGRAAFQKLARAASAVLEGFRPGVAARLGIDYATLCQSHPALVYASLSGYGQQGEDSQRASHDVNYLAETGVLGLANPIGLPGATFADGLAGLAAALNLLAALQAAARDGRGQRLDLAIVDGLLFLMATELESFWRTGAARGPGGSHLTGRYPWYGVHATADGGAVALGAVEPGFYQALCRGIGHPELAGSQLAEGEEGERARTVFRRFFAARTRDEAIAALGGADACASPVRSTREVAESALMRRAEREGGERLVRSPVRLPLPPLSEAKRGAQVLERFGFARAEIDALVREGALAED